jgi:AcrR family transcriptional regulator
MARTYQLKQRARKQEETRRRIVDAVVALHQEVGPANTTISGIAERAGVQRLTVYRHFPDEQSLIFACGTQWMTDNPPPDPEHWVEIVDPGERLRTGLTELYAYYSQTEGMNSNILRDLEKIPALAEASGTFQQTLVAYRRILIEGWPADPECRPWLDAAISHALWFETWRSLVRYQQLNPADAVELMVLIVQATVRTQLPAESPE